MELNKMQVSGVIIKELENSNWVSHQKMPIFWKSYIPYWTLDHPASILPHISAYRNHEILKEPRYMANIETKWKQILPSLGRQDGAWGGKKDEPMNVTNWQLKQLEKQSQGN